MVAAPKTHYVGNRKGPDTMKSKTMKPMHSAKEMKQMHSAKPAPKPAAAKSVKANAAKAMKKGGY